MGRRAHGAHPALGGRSRGVRRERLRRHPPPHGQDPHPPRTHLQLRRHPQHRHRRGGDHAEDEDALHRNADQPVDADRRPRGAGRYRPEPTSCCSSSTTPSPRPSSSAPSNTAPTSSSIPRPSTSTATPTWSAAIAVLHDDDLAAQVQFIQKSVGAVPGPFDAWLALRGLKTLTLRMKQHDANGRRIAQWLEADRRVPQVFYPGLPSPSPARSRLPADAGVRRHALHRAGIAVRAPMTW